MTLNDLYLDLRQQLKKAGADMAELEAREIAAYVADADKRNTIGWAYRFLSEETPQRAKQLLARRLSGEPLAYLLGEWDFYGLTFLVTQDVLIPRPDTERLCELAVETVKDIVNPRVLDLCCGSGCIGIALLTQVEEARVVAVDVSSQALEIAKENASRNGVDSRYDAVEMSMLNAPDERLGQFHLLVCNPPYISAEEMKTLDQSVLGYEPVLALYGGDDGLDFYRAAASLWKDAMLPSGWALFECGWRQACQVAAVLEEQQWREITISEDYAGIQRVVAAKAPPQSF